MSTFTQGRQVADCIEQQAVVESKEVESKGVESKGVESRSVESEAVDQATYEDILGRRDQASERLGFDPRGGERRRVGLEHTGLGCVGESTTPVRLLIVSDTEPYRNGVGAYYADLMADIEPLLSAVDICCPSTASLDLASSWPWSRGISFPMPGDTTQRVRLPHVPTLTRHIHKFRPDVIVSATPGGYGIMAAHIGRQLGVKVFAGFHTCFTQIARLYWRRWRCLGARGLSLACHHVLFSMADEVLVNSPDMMRLAREHGARRVRLVGTPVTPKYLSTPVRRLPTSVEKVLFVGRLAAEKNIEAVVRAAISLPHMQFSFVGDGPERRKLERISRSLPNVRLHGWVDRSAMDRVLDDHDVLVLPSRIESFGTVALEAMARQRLVIVSPACGITEWPCLRGGLRVMDPQETLTEALIDVSRLNAFGLFSQGALARAAVRQHVLWNRRLWSTALVEPVQAWSRSAVWRACARDMLTGWL